MCYATVVAGLIPCAAFYAERTISHCRSAFLDCILQSASRLPAPHPLPPARFDALDIFRQESCSGLLPYAVFLEII